MFLFDTTYRYSCYICNSNPSVDYSNSGYSMYCDYKGKNIPCIFQEYAIYFGIN